MITVLNELESKRAIELLMAARKLLNKQMESYYVINMLEETVHYDGEDCDGYCLMEDICVLFDEIASRSLSESSSEDSEELKPGDLVAMTDKFAEGREYANSIWTVASNPWSIADGSKLVLLEGKRGGYDVSGLRKIV